MLKVKILDIAVNDMQKIYDYIAEDNETEALKMLDKFEKAFSQLERFPESAPLVTDSHLSKKGYRKIVVDNYLIFYCIMETEVQIRRVLNGAVRYKNLI